MNLARFGANINLCMKEGPASLIIFLRFFGLCMLFVSVKFHANPDSLYNLNSSVGLPMNGAGSMP